jgi:hypothetical protein
MLVMDIAIGQKQRFTENKTQSTKHAVMINLLVNVLAPRPETFANGFAQKRSRERQPE